MSYKSLVSAAPAHSILNADFHYTNSAATDIRKTFARIRRDRAKSAIAAGAVGNVRPLSKPPQEAHSRWRNCK